jgi:putative membrane protein
MKLSLPRHLKFSMPLMCAAAAATLMHGAFAAELSRGDERFLRKAGESGLLEIQASQIAVERAQHPDVKRYAEMMIRDHTAVDQELKALAGAKGFQLPTEPARGQKRLLEKLRDLEGHDFDEEYADEVAVDAHEDAVKLFEKASEGAEDADIKAFAAKHLPALQKHLDEGRRLEDAVDEGDEPNDTRAAPATGSAVPATGRGMTVPGTGADTGAGAPTAPR